MVSIKDIETTLKKVLSNASVQSIDSVYEKTKKGYLLVIDFKNLFLNKTNIIFTKLIFEVDKDKIALYGISMVLNYTPFFLKLFLPP